MRIFQRRSAVAIAHASCDDRIVAGRLVGVLLRRRQIFDGVGQRGAVAPVDVNRSAGVLAGDADGDGCADLADAGEIVAAVTTPRGWPALARGCEQADEQGAHQRFSPVPSRQSSHDFILPGAPVRRPTRMCARIVPEAIDELMARIFLLSPAHCGGNRARIVMSERATFSLAVRLRSEGGAPLGEVFSFHERPVLPRQARVRARVCARRRNRGRPSASAGVFVITPTAGLRSVETAVTLEALRASRASTSPPTIHAIAGRSGERARAGRRDRPGLRRRAARQHRVAEVCRRAAGDLRRPLLFPVDFVGRGDMSRGGLMLRSSASGEELRLRTGRRRRPSRPAAGRSSRPSKARVP